MPERDFNLDQALAGWRQKMMANGITAAGLLDELEGHLRDDIDAQLASGVAANHAFESAEARIGAPSELQTEFKNAGVSLAQEDPRMKRFFFTLAGIPQNSAAVALDGTNPLIEPAWATYLKAALILIPALLLWSFCGIFLLPKLEYMFRDAAKPVSGFFEISRWLFDNSSAIALLMFAGLVVLEYKTAFWNRYRRATIGLGVVLINTAVLTLLTATVVLALYFFQLIHI